LCGFAGFQGRFDPATLDVVNDVQRHRGPDDQGRFFEPNSGVGLAHVRLSIQDVSHLGHQPMASDDGGVVLVYNGEIYNFRELREELVGRGHIFRGRSDTEVLLRLYLDIGAEVFLRLNGIFALALWDRRRGRLLLARDAFGIKPLYWSQTPRGIVFASELKGLLAISPEPRSLDMASVHRYLTYLWCPGAGTPLRGVQKLGPGEAIEVHAGRVERHWTWYETPPHIDGRNRMTASEAVARTRETLRVAVHRQVVSDVPVGAFLSGGLDSSAVVTFAREVVPELKCFTIKTTNGQDPGMTDDLPYAQRVARHLDVNLEVVTVDGSAMAGDVEGMVAQLDEPLADPAALNVWYISRLAREHGIKVLLSGAAGDDLLTGYRRHVAVRHEPLWSWLPRGIRGALAGGFAALDQRRAFSRRLSTLFSKTALDGDSRLVSYFAWAEESRLLELYAPELHDVAARTPASEPMLALLEALPTGMSPLERMLALEQRFFLIDHNLAYTDRMSMAAGVETRVPFLDLDFVRHAARVPTAFKQRGAVGKWVLKEAMAADLPADVIHRPKTGFGAPLRRLLRQELKEVVSDLLSESSLRQRGLFDPAAVQRLIQRHEVGSVDAAYTIFALLCMEIWCRTYLDAAWTRL
jgi:asparagine synthase (glutamine-hydrolysing)